MTKVEQKETNCETGDCMRASIASVLEVDIETVPHLTRIAEDRWFQVFYYFMIGHGYKYDGCHWKGRLPKSRSFNGFYLVSVPSRTYPPEDKINHMVVMDSNWDVVHDPNPNKAWQGENLRGSENFNYAYLFRKLNSTDLEYFCYATLPDVSHKHP